MRVLLLLLCGLLLLGGCVVTETVTTPPPPPPAVQCGAEPRPERLDLLPISPYGCVACPDGGVQCEEEELVTAVCLTPDHFENWAVNNQVVISRLRQGGSVVRFYRDCIESHNEQIRELGEQDSPTDK